MEEMIKTCRFCLEEEAAAQGKEKMISPCACIGTAEWIHPTCLAIWRAESSQNKDRCGLCGAGYVFGVSAELRVAMIQMYRNNARRKAEKKAERAAVAEMQRAEEEMQKAEIAEAKKLFAKALKRKMWADMRRLGGREVDHAEAVVMERFMRDNRTDDDIPTITINGRGCLVITTVCLVCLIGAVGTVHHLTMHPWTNHLLTFVIESFFENNIAYFTGMLLLCGLRERFNEVIWWPLAGCYLMSVTFCFVRRAAVFATYGIPAMMLYIIGERDEYAEFFPEHNGTWIEVR